MTDLSPGLILIIGAVLVPLLRGRVRSAYLLALPALAFAQTLSLGQGDFGQVQLFDMTLTTLRVDGLSLVFAYVFLIAALLGLLFALHVEDTLQHVATLVYAGSAVGAVFAGDLITLFVFWEGTAIASVFLIWARRSEAAYRAGMRYLIVQVGSGVLLLAGAVVHYGNTGDIAFGALDLNTVPGVLIFVAFGIKCAFPLLHGWLKDAYPEATVTGAVILSAFTTKLAVYALARGFAGTEMLIPIGAAMALFPIAFALIENDFRRVLAYSLNSQLGFMVVGVGIGTELALSGAVAHAFSSVLYKGLLFMTMGAVLYRAGTVKGSELGGLYRSMPWTAAFCIVGAATISAVPLTTGFVSKALILSGTMYDGHFWAWLALLLGGVGAFYHTGLKIPYFAFFGRESGIRCQEAPGNMLAAMGLSAALCVGLGVLPGALYAVLPFPVDYQPYSAGHVATQLQLLLFAGQGFMALVGTGLFPRNEPSTILDIDWLYRRVGKSAALGVREWGVSAWQRLTARVGDGLAVVLATLHRYHGPHGLLARAWTTGGMAMWTTLLLAAYLIVYYL